MRKMEETINELVHEKQIMENFRELIDKNISDASFESKTKEIKIKELQKERYERIIEYDKLKKLIESKEKQLK